MNATVPSVPNDASSVLLPARVPTVHATLTRPSAAVFTKSALLVPPPAITLKATGTSATGSPRASVTRTCG